MTRWVMYESADAGLLSASPSGSQDVTAPLLRKLLSVSSTRPRWWAALLEPSTAFEPVDASLALQLRLQLGATIDRPTRNRSFEYIHAQASVNVDSPWGCQTPAINIHFISGS